MSNLKIGHTGITWPSDDDYLATVKTIAAEGFGGIELFAWTLPKIEAQGKLDIFEEYNIPLWSAYFSHDILERGNMKSEFEKMKRFGEILVKKGGTHAAFGGNIIDRRKYNYIDHRDDIIEIVNESGKVLQDLGIRLCFHPHTGTPIETQSEIMDFFQHIDPKYVGFAPDIAQIAKGGGNPMEIMQTFDSLIEHFHFKDYGGKCEFDRSQVKPLEGETYFNFNDVGKEIDATGYVNYCVLGDGVVDLLGILKFLEDKNYTGHVMVELDGTNKMPISAEESVHRNHLYLQKHGYMA